MEYGDDIRFFASKTTYKFKFKFYLFKALEWQGFKEGERNIKIKFDEERKKLHITDRGKKPLRMLDLRHTTDRVHIRLSDDKQCRLISIRAPGEIDLVI